MASRIMHYIVGLCVSERICFEVPRRFLFGNMLPDCVNGPGGRTGPKEQSHFWERKEEAKGQNWNWFWDKYGAYQKDELYLGYFCHLVTDAVWGREVYMPLKRKHGAEHLNLKTGALYRDYHRMNELLRGKFQLPVLEMHWIENEIEEVQKSFWNVYRQELMDDLKEDTGAKKEDLELMDYDDIVSFIASAVSVCCDEMLAKREGRQGRGPEEFYY